MQVIVNQGELSTDMYIVQMGEAEVMAEKHSLPLAVLKEGDIFGEVRATIKLCCIYDNWVDGNCFSMNQLTLRRLKCLSAKCGQW
jgi:hypothetical protein